MVIQANTERRFEEWLFNLTIVVALDNTANDFIRFEAKQAKKRWKAGKPLLTPSKEKDRDAIAVLNRLIRADRPAETLALIVKKIEFHPD